MSITSNIANVASALTNGTEVHNLNAEFLNGQPGSYYTSYAETANTNNIIYTNNAITSNVEVLQGVNATQNASISAAFLQANSAYDNSNTKFSSSGGSISGPVTIDSSLLVTGDFTVSGNTTTLNVETLTIEDKNIVLANTASPTDILADGAGLTIKGDSDKTFNWVDSTDSWTSSENLNLLSGKTFKIAGTDVLSGNTLGSGITSSSLTSVGTLGSLNVTGNVGIGTSPPSRKLHVYGGVDGDIIGQFQNGSGSTSHICFSNTGSNADQVRIGSSGGDLLLSTNYTERLRIDSSGNVGIGASGFSNLGAINTPSVGLYSSSGARLGLWGNGGRWWYLEGESSNRFGIGFRGAFNTTDNNVITLNTSGNVGIGTSSPGAKLDVVGGIKTSSYMEIRSDTGAFYFENANNNRYHRIGLTGSNTSPILQFDYYGGTNIINTLAIDSSGNVGVGATDMSVSGANAKLAISGGVLNLDDGQSVAWGGGTGRPSVRGTKSSSLMEIIAGTTYVSGNMGIGTSSPSYPFHVRKDQDAVTWSAAANATAIGGHGAGFISVAGASNNYSYFYTSAVGNLLISNSAAGYVAVANNGAERLRIDSSGNVGIGTSSPNQKLTVYSTTSDNQIELGYASTFGWRFGRKASDGSLRFTGLNGGSTVTDVLTLDLSGNLGLGVTPGSVGGGHVKLSMLNQGNGLLASTDSIHLTDNCYWNGSSWVRVDTTAPGYLQIVDSAFKFFTGTGGAAGGAFAPNQAMTLDASGNLLVGSTSPLAGFNNQISSTGALTNRGCLVVGRTTAATTGVCGSLFSYNGSNVVCGMDFQSNGANNSGYIQVYTYSAGTFAQGPYLNTGGTNWTAASDIRLKDVSGTIQNALNKTLSIRAIEYTLKSDPTKIKRVGLVAQELQEVLPEAVTEDTNGYLGVQYTDVIPLLVAAIKELHAEIETLKQKVN